MSTTLKSSLVYLAIVSALSIAALPMTAGQCAAAIPEKASSQLDDIGSPSVCSPSSPEVVS